MNEKLEQVIGIYAMAGITGESAMYEQFIHEASELRHAGHATQKEIEAAIAKTDRELEEIGF